MLYLTTRTGCTPWQLVLRAREAPSEAFLRSFHDDLDKMADGCPVQYVLGEAVFCGLHLSVNPSVLIPRPETEELVQLIVERHRHDGRLSVWDVGTGSGCIAVALSQHLPQARIYATDISAKALETARLNAERHKAGIHFALHDMTGSAQLPWPMPELDIIAANPPYIPDSMKTCLHQNVAHYEPSEALFVADDDPLAFYRALARLGNRHLRPGGTLYAETGEDYHRELGKLLSDSGYVEFESLTDLNGKRRFVTAKTADNPKIMRY